MPRASSAPPPRRPYPLLLRTRTVIGAVAITAGLLVAGCGGGPGQGRFEQVPLLQIAPGEEVDVVWPSGDPGMLVDAGMTIPPASRRSHVPSASASPP